MDTVCPTIAELPDELRHYLPLPQWAACHRALRTRPVGAAAGYETLLANIEVIGLVAQAEMAIASTPTKPCTS